MRNMRKNTFILSLITVLSVAGVIWLIRAPVKPGKLDAFASCLADSGTKYYGAFWCPNCKNQCSTPDGRGQLPVCQDAKIQGYPTWEFVDGTRESGTQTLELLSKRTNCPLPEVQ
jgi:hypothetical protein